MMTTYLKVLLLFAMLFTLNACEEDSVLPTDCDSYVQINPRGYDDAKSSFFTIIDASIVDNCLEINYSSSGCSGDSWEASLVDAGVILESFPVQRNLKMILDNEEACAAVFTKTTSFDLTPIQLEEYREIILNLEGYEEQVSYSYDAPISVEAEIERRWSLININGGLTGSDIDFSVGTIIWDFKASQVAITNNNAAEVYDGFTSGLYQYNIQESQGSYELVIDEQNLGSVTISDENLLIDQRAADGFQFIFVKI